METKSAFKSRTVWFNVLGGASAFLAANVGIVPPQYLAYVVLAQSAINIVLRWVTTQPISVNP